VNQFNADNKLFWESPRDLHLLSPLARYGQKKLEEFLAHYLSEFSAMMKKEFLERPEEGEKRYSRSRVGLSDSREILKEDAEFKTRGISKLFNIIVDLDRKNGISLGKKFLLCSNHYSERETTLKAFYCQRLAEKFAIFGFHAPADLRVEFEEKKIFDLNAKALSLSEQVVSRILGEETAWVQDASITSPGRTQFCRGLIFDINLKAAPRGHSFNLFTSFGQL